MSGVELNTYDLFGRYLDVPQCYIFAMQQRNGLCVIIPGAHIAVPLSRPNICSIRANDDGATALYYSEALCMAEGGQVWLGPDGPGWRPTGPCFMLNISSEQVCYQETGVTCLGIQYKGVPCHSYCSSSGQTNATCRAATPVCNSGSVTDGTFRNYPVQPPGYSFKNVTECEACGGYMEDWYNWVPSKWSSDGNTMVRPKWVPNPLDLPSFGPTLSPLLFSELLERARTTRLNSIFVAELYCNYGTQSSLLSSISCACGKTSTEGANADNRCLDDLTRLTGSPAGVVSICQGIDSQTPIFGAVFISNNVTLYGGPGSACTDAYISIVPKTQFEFKQSEQTSSLAIISETESAKLSSIFVYNEADVVVVGQVLGDGFGITYSSTFINRSISGFSICISIPSNASWSLKRELYSWDIAFVPEGGGGDDSTFRFVPLGLNFPKDSPFLCVELNGTAVGTYFPIGMIQDWQDATISNSWSSPERGLMIFIIVTFCILVLWIMLTLFLRIQRLFEMKRTKKIPFPHPEVALFSVLMLSCLGVIYYIGKYVGAYPGSALNSLFSDLPQLNLLICVTIIGVSWQVLSFTGGLAQKEETLITKLGPYVFLSLLCFTFIALSIAVATTDSKIEYTCATLNAERTSRTSYEKIEISYKSIYAFYTAIITCAYLFYGIAAVRLLWGVDKVKEARTKYLIATVVATLALIVTVGVSLYSTQYVLENTTKLAFVIAILILPGYAIAYVYNLNSNFVQKITSITRTSKKTSSATSKTSENKSTGKEGSWDS